MLLVVVCRCDGLRDGGREDKMKVLAVQLRLLAESVDWKYKEGI